MNPDPYVLANELSVARADIATYVQVSADQQGEIERQRALLSALFVFRDNANAEIARLRTALAVCVKELDDAHNFVQAELDARIATHTIGGDLSTLDEADGGLCGEAMDCLERIDAARDVGRAALTKES